MTNNTLLYEIVLPILAVIMLLLVLFVVFIFINVDAKHKLNKANIMFFELDLTQWRIKKKNIIWNKFIQKTNIDNRINSLIDNGWVDINKFFSIFNEDDVQKWKDAIQFCVQNKAGTKINLTIDLLKGRKSFWDITMFYNSENTLLLNVKWTNSSKKNTKARMVDKSILLDKNNMYKLFISFNLVNADDKDELINKYISIFKIKKNIDYFVFKKIIVFVHEFKTFDKMQKYRLKFDKLFSNVENKMIFNGYSDAIAYVDAHEIRNENDLVKILTRISFGISKSKLIYKPFYFSIKNIHFNEFEEYKETINMLNNVIKNQSFKVEENVVTSLSTLHNYPPIIHVDTGVKIDKNNWFPLIVNTTSFDEKIRTLSFEHELKLASHKESKPIILDINDYDVNIYFSKMLKNKHIIYVINVIEYKKPLQLIELLELLSKNKIKYGLRINEITSSVFSIINNSSPSLIIFTEKLLNQFREGNFSQNINYIGLILMCERLFITPIFENIDDRLKSNFLNIGRLEKFSYKSS